MIVSASYKTDIPAFYGSWFLNRLRAGYCRMVNPYNPKQKWVISLRPGELDGIVFWTKNAGPFVDVLKAVRGLEIPFVMNYTLNGYPRELESRVVGTAQAIEQIKAIAGTYGPRVVVWRYDPIVVSSLTRVDDHLRNFESLSQRLSGTTDEVVVSFVHFYKKTLRNLHEAGQKHHFQWMDPDVESQKSLLLDLAAIAATRGMRLSTCSQPELEVPGVHRARCIDAQRLMDVGACRFAARLKSKRVGCGCFESKDIGDYDTCPHGCVYCYAVRDRELALTRYRQHDPLDEYLFPPSNPAQELPNSQLELF